MATLMEQIVNSEFVQQIKFRGILGKLTLLAVVAIIASVFEVKSVSDWHVQLAIILANSFIVLAILGIVCIYSLKNPNHATLEGREVIEFKKLQMGTMADPIIAIRSRTESSNLSAGSLQIEGGEK